MADAGRMFLVECYLPGVSEADVTAAGDRARLATEALQADGRVIEYLGATLIAGDEAVFHAFRASDAALVGEASRTAGLAFERIVESVAIRVDPMTTSAVTGEARPAARKGHGR
jgi:hypothetical protein